jgi:hypothetical protein
MTVQIGSNQINSSGGFNFSTTDGVVALHDTLGNVVNSQRPWFKYQARTTTVGVWSNYVGTYGVGNGQNGNCFDASAGRFTAPIAGIYQFNATHITRSNSSDTRVALYKNGSYQYTRSIVVSTVAPHHNNANQGHTLYLAAGDYAEMANHSGSGTHEDNWNHFSGFYVGEYN